MIEKSWQYICVIAGMLYGFLYGETTGLFLALLGMMAIDYITGIIIAVSKHTLSSEIGFKGIGKKALILMLVAVGHLVDRYVLGNGSAIMTTVNLFYVANEGISILENAGNLGLPLPKKLKKILIQIKNDSEDDKNE